MVCVKTHSIIPKNPGLYNRNREQGVNKQQAGCGGARLYKKREMVYNTGVANGKNREAGGMVTLKRCPFCGSLAGYSRVPGQGFSVICRGCAAIAMHEKARERDMMGQAWNRRAPLGQPASGLAPCPFCGGGMPNAGFTVGDGTIIRCGHCGMMVTFANSASSAESLALWNRRSGL